MAQKKLWILTEDHGMLTLQQMRQGFPGYDPGNNSVRLPESRNREHKALASQEELAVSFYTCLPTLHLHM